MAGASTPDSLKDSAGIQIVRWGGARPGAGRKPKPLHVVRKHTAEQILSNVDEIALWGELLLDKDPRIRFDALRYLTDRRDGKAPQAVAPSEEDRITVNVKFVQPTPRTDPSAIKPEFK